MVAERMQAATANLTPPFAVVDLDALESNAVSMITRARPLPIRLATKSIRCRAITDHVLGRSGFQGVLAYSLAEAIWLAGSGITDVLTATRLLILPEMSRITSVDGCRGGGSN
jgi:D-serine deaminase-like pyridoxal phosphate-dependent protein